MGYWSDRSIEEMEGPNIGEIDKFVCADCVVDSALSELVQSHPESNWCDYCGKSTDRPSAAPFNVVMQRIFSAISTQYADAQDLDLPWVEGSWLTKEIDAYEVVGEFDPGWDDDFITDVIDCLDPFTYWAKHTHGDWLISNPSQTLRYGWEEFKDQVLTKTRYLFSSEPDDEYDSGPPDYLPISKMLVALGGLLRRLSPPVILSSGSQPFYRVRTAKPSESWTTFEALGVPPVGNASAGRMNPPGIPYFYLAMEPDTAVEEVVSGKTKYFMAQFISQRSLRLLDLVNLPEPPSLFLPELYDERHEIIFLQNFVSDIAKPVAKDGREHIEYVPTQIVSEYLRYRYRDSEEQAIDGLLYPSVKNSGGKNLVIFDSSNESLSESFLLVNVDEC